MPPYPIPRQLTNIFSTEFSVETVDAARRLRYTQAWTCTMVLLFDRRRGSPTRASTAAASSSASALPSMLAMCGD